MFSSLVLPSGIAHKRSRRKDKTALKILKLPLGLFNKMGLISSVKCMQPCPGLGTFCPGKLLPGKSNLPTEDGLTKDRSEGQKTTLSLFRIIMGSLYAVVFRKCLGKLVKHVPLTMRSPPPDITVINGVPAG